MDEELVPFQFQPVNISKDIVTAFEARTLQLHNEALAVAVIESEQDCKIAVNWQNTAKTFIDEVEESELGVSKRVMHKFHDGLSKLMGRFQKPVKEDIKTVERAVSNYYLAEERRRQEEARRAAEEDRKRQEEQKINAAVQLEKTNPKLSEAILNTPTHAAPITPEVMKFEDASVSKKYVARLVDKVAFLKMAATRHEYLGCITINVNELSRMATKAEGKIDIAGVELVPEISLRRSA